jgi:hypothetical protein
MTASNNVSVVFEADLGAGNSGSGWGVSFGGKTLSGVGDDGGPLSCDPVGASECTTNVSVEFSTNGSSYSSFGSVQLTAEDTRFDVPLAATSSQTGYVRLGLAPGAGAAQPLIDNVAITLPEPGSTLALLAGVLSLLALPRRRA